MMKRRDFLLGMAAASAMGLSGKLYSAPRDSPRLLLVFLRGGYDTNNLLVPYASSFYHESRPTIAIARPGGPVVSSVVQLDADWGLAPALRDSIAPLYAGRQVAFIPFAGTSNLSRSHFATQDDIEKGLPEKSPMKDSGFMGRLCKELSTRQAISFTPSLPLILRGGLEIPNISLTNLQKNSLVGRRAEALLQLYENDPLHDAVQDGLQIRREVASEFSAEMMAASKGAVSSRGFEGQASRIAAMMKERYRIGFVDVGGWDTHINQGGAQGLLANKLAELSRGLVRYAEGLGEEWENTVVVVVSEFGRTFRENGNRGTDHGHGTAYWVLGGSINGGRIVGEQVKVAPETLFQERDYPVLNNYRDVLAGIIQPMWELSAASMARIFPGAQALKLEIV